MSDKILVEAFDKLKAIEESEDPFCIGATADEVVETYTEVAEDDYEGHAEPSSGLKGISPDSLASTIQAMMKMDARNLQNVLRQSGYRDTGITNTSLKSFNVGADGISGVYEIQFNSQGESGHGNVYVTWNGQDFVADF